MYSIPTNSSSSRTKQYGLIHSLLHHSDDEDFTTSYYHSTSTPSSSSDDDDHDPSSSFHSFSAFVTSLFPPGVASFASAAWLVSSWFSSCLPILPTDDQDKEVVVLLTTDLAHDSCLPPTASSSSSPSSSSPSSSSPSSSPSSSSPSSSPSLSSPSSSPSLSSPSFSPSSPSPSSSPPPSAALPLLTLPLPPRGTLLSLRDHGYELLCPLSHSHHSSTHLIRCLQGGGVWVGKVIDLSLAHEKERRRAEEEARFLKELKHDSIVAFRESFLVHEGGACMLVIVMEYCERGDLFAFISQKQKRGEWIQEQQVLEWLLSVARGLSYMHYKGVIHCDLKSTNIFITAHGKAKIGDLGISRLLQEDGVHHLSPCGYPHGTPLYMPPELISNSSPLTDRNDCWALGCVLFEMCCLLHAFQGATAAELIQNIEQNISQVKNMVPKHVYSKFVQDLIQKLLQKQPEKRPSIRQVLAALVRYNRRHRGRRARRAMRGSNRAGRHDPYALPEVAGDKEEREILREQDHSSCMNLYDRVHHHYDINHLCKEYMDRYNIKSEKKRMFEEKYYSYEEEYNRNNYNIHNDVPNVFGSASMTYPVPLASPSIFLCSPSHHSSSPSSPCLFSPDFSSPPISSPPSPCTSYSFFPPSIISEEPGTISACPCPFPPTLVLSPPAQGSPCALRGLGSPDPTHRTRAASRPQVATSLPMRQHHQLQPSICSPFCSSNLKENVVTPLLSPPLSHLPYSPFSSPTPKQHSRIPPKPSDDNKLITRRRNKLYKIIYKRYSTTKSSSTNSTTTTNCGKARGAVDLTSGATASKRKTPPSSIHSSRLCI